MKKNTKRILMMGALMSAGGAAFMMYKNGIWNLSPAYDITYSNGTGYTKNHQLSLNGKTNDFTLNDILQLAKKHSIKENIAKEYLEQILEVCLI